ncbi:MAG: adaptor protein MecA [Lachnospiraceae bacterium]|nr:adaptor protein MecA [Lachnospiraceae bacterium]MEE1342207.1 adaptor protein MecA [Lachnospiraceae bacterium]
MKFIRLNQNTVRCIVSEEDIKEQGLEIEDFLTNKDKAHEFLQQIVELAAKEVGYESKNGVVAMQVMPLPMNGLAITFSDREEIGMMDLISEIKNALGFLKESLPPEEATTKEKTNSNPQLVYECQSLDQVQQFASVIQTKKTIKSHLYKQLRGYYLVIEKGRLSKEEFKELTRQATEYLDYCSDKLGKIAFVKEHCIPLIKNKALATFKKMNELDENETQKEPLV